MPYTLVASPSGRKSLKKLPKVIQKHIREKLQELQSNPLSAPPLQGRFSHLRSLHTRFQSVDYRVIYHVDTKKQQVIIIYVATRQNIYRELDRLNTQI